MNLKGKKAVLFDLDGVLFNTEYMAAKYMVEDGEAVGISVDFDLVLSLAGLSHVEFRKIVNEALKDQGGLDEYHKRVSALPERPLPFRDIVYDGVKQLLPYLRNKGFRIAVCSASQMDYIETALKEGNIRQYFDYVVSGCDLKRSKPDPAIYLLAMEELGMKPEECVVIEDSAYGIEAGKRAGCMVIAYHDPTYSYDQRKADVIIENYDVLMQEELY